jgi:hypothetical protein
MYVPHSISCRLIGICLTSVLCQCWTTIGILPLLLLARSSTKIYIPDQLCQCQFRLPALGSHHLDSQLLVSGQRIPHLIQLNVRKNEGGIAKINPCLLGHSGVQSLPGPGPAPTLHFPLASNWTPGARLPPCHKLKFDDQFMKKKSGNFFQPV